MKFFPFIPRLILATLMAGCHQETAPEPAGNPTVTGENISFPADSPQLASLALAPAALWPPVSMPLTGRLIWNDDVTVRVFTPFAGRVRRLTADLGQIVTNGAALAEVESPDFGQAQADARKANGDLKLAERNLARLHELSAHGAAAQKDVEAAEDTQEQAQAEQARAFSKMAAYGASVDSPDEIFVLRTPLAGTVVDKNVSAGQEIRPDQMLANIPEVTAPLFVVSDPAQLWIQIDATEADLPRLQAGRTFTFTSRAFPEETFTGRVQNVSAFINPDTRTIQVRGAVDNSRRLLKAEMFVNVNLAGQSATAISVPSAAVFLNGDRHYIFTQEKPGQFIRREVSIGLEQDGQIPILHGLEPGQQVVTDGCVLLQQLME